MRPAFKCHGGKWYLATWIISLFPEDYSKYTYIEPYCGGANVFINKEKSDVEVIGDTDTAIIQIYRALRDEPKEFYRRLSLLKYKEETFLWALGRQQGPFDDYLDQAVNEFVLRRMSRGGLCKAFAWSERLRGGQPGDLNAWKTALELLDTISERLRGVYILNKPAIEVIKSFNNDNVLLYCDPPYLHETRTSKNIYKTEMTVDDHIDLAKILNAFNGKVILSGYHSPLYSRLFKDWNCEQKKIANHASQKKNKKMKTEVCWKNF